MAAPLPLPNLLCFALYSANHAMQAAYKPLLDEALRLSSHKPERVLMVDRGLAPMPLTEGRDADYATEAAHAALARQFAERTAKKTYLAVVRGRPRASAGAVHGAIARRNCHWLVPSVGAKGAWLSFDELSGRWSGWDASSGTAITLTAEGRKLSRVVAAVFDTYLSAGRARHSVAV